MKMEIYIEMIGAGRDLIIKHNDKEVRFNVSGYDRRIFEPVSPDDVDIVKHINDYWESLPNFKQEKIFECYVNIKNVFESTYDTILLTNALLDPIKSLFDEHPIQEVEEWLVWKSDVIIPTKNSAGKVIFENTYVHDDMKPGTKVQTYTRNDYIGLISMALSLRIMVPIWGEFLYRIRGPVGTNFKEMHSLHLLRKTDIINCTYMDRLREYINSNTKIDDSIFGAILDGIGSEDYPQWIYSLVIVRRLCIGNFSGVNPDINLVTFIFNYVRQKMGPNGTSAFGGNIVNDKFKYFDDNSNDDDNASRTESYKIRQSVPTGDLVSIDFYLSNPIAVANALDPSISPDLLSSCLNSCMVFKTNVIWPVQVTLAKWIMSKVIPARAFNNLSKEKVINAIAISQAWLFSHDHKELGCLIGAIASDNSQTMQLGGIDSRSRITREQMEILNILYPFTTIRSSKQKTKPANEAVVAIDEVSTQLSHRDWILTAAPEYVKSVTGDPRYTRYSSPYDAKIKLAALIIDIKSDTVKKLKNLS